MHLKKKYLNYFIHPLCGYAQWQYWKVIKDKEDLEIQLVGKLKNILNLKILT